MIFKIFGALCWGIVCLVIAFWITGLARQTTEECWHGRTVPSFDNCSGLSDGNTRK